MNWAAVVGKITGTIDQHLLDCNAYLLAENRVYGVPRPAPRPAPATHRLALANAAKPLGRTVLAELATIVTPDTLLRWHRKLVEKIVMKEPDTRAGPGRPPTGHAVVELVLRFAHENPLWGYDRIAGALAELGHAIADTTVGDAPPTCRSVPVRAPRKARPNTFTPRTLASRQPSNVLQ